MKSLVYFLSTTTSAFALVGRDRRNIETAHPDRYTLDKDSNAQLWPTGDNHNAHRRFRTHTRTMTITVTVTQTGAPFLQTDTDFSTVTVPVGNITSPSSSDDLAPITLIDVNTLQGTDEVPTPTSVDNDLVSVTSIESNTADNAGAPTPNDLAPITLIDINTLGLKRRMPKETGKLR